MIFPGISMPAKWGSIRQRLLITPTRSQYAATGQPLQRGETGRQVFLPKATSSVL